MIGTVAAGVDQDGMVHDGGAATVHDGASTAVLSSDIAAAVAIAGETFVLIAGVGAVQGFAGVYGVTAANRYG